MAGFTSLSVMVLSFSVVGVWMGMVVSVIGGAHSCSCDLSVALFASFARALLASFDTHVAASRSLLCRSAPLGPFRLLSRVLLKARHYVQGFHGYFLLHSPAFPLVIVKTILYFDSSAFVEYFPCLCLGGGMLFHATNSI